MTCLVPAVCACDAAPDPDELPRLLTTAGEVVGAGGAAVDGDACRVVVVVPDSSDDRDVEALVDTAECAAPPQSDDAAGHPAAPGAAAAPANRASHAPPPSGVQSSMTDASARRTSGPSLPRASTTHARTWRPSDANSPDKPSTARTARETWTMRWQPRPSRGGRLMYVRCGAVRCGGRRGQAASEKPKRTFCGGRSSKRLRRQAAAPRRRRRRPHAVGGSLLTRRPGDRRRRTDRAAP
mmetsp:Transcript_26943/g.107828  ORF Transcript_26943/g.107828 Transcript_26943/m.107828 type:complete len:239 (-) Transcript_26943:74-790(-)